MEVPASHGQGAICAGQCLNYLAVFPHGACPTSTFPRKRRSCGRDGRVHLEFGEPAVPDKINAHSRSIIRFTFRAFSKSISIFMISPNKTTLDELLLVIETLPPERTLTGVCDVS